MNWKQLKVVVGCRNCTWFLQLKTFANWQYFWSNSQNDCILTVLKPHTTQVQLLMTYSSHFDPEYRSKPTTEHSKLLSKQVLPSPIYSEIVSKKEKPPCTPATQDFSTMLQKFTDVINCVFRCLYRVLIFETFKLVYKKQLLKYLYKPLSTQCIYKFSWHRE